MVTDRFLLSGDVILIILESRDQIKVNFTKSQNYLSVLLTASRVEVSELALSQCWLGNTLS